VKCTICGQDAPQGAKLCAHCAAALKRAYDTVSPIELALGRARRARLRSGAGSAELVALSSAPSRGARANARANARAAASASKNAQRLRVATTVALVAAAAGLCMAGYFAFLKPVPAGKGAAAPAAASTRDAGGANPEAAPVTEPVTGIAKQAAPPPETIAVPDAVRPPEPSSGIANKHDGSKSQSGKSRSLPPPTPVAPAVSTPPAPVAAEPAAVAVPPAAVREAPKPDRWQQMAAALAPCAREDFFGRILCEQRVRSEYCEGYWGQVPLCATAQSYDRAR
jgi:hypothetical protein